MQTRPPSPLGWLSLGWGTGGPPSVCDGRGQTALEILKQRPLKGQRESTGRHPCRAEPWTTRPPESQGALSQDCGLGGRRLWGPGVPPLRGAEGGAGVPRPRCPGPCWALAQPSSEPATAPQALCQRPVAVPSIPGSFENSPLPKGTLVDSGGRPCLWSHLLSANSSSASGRWPRPSSRHRSFLASHHKPPAPWRKTQSSRATSPGTGGAGSQRLHSRALSPPRPGCCR